MDRAGRIYVLESRPERIKVFGADGAWIRTISRAGAGPGEIQNAAGMVWDPRGQLWVINQDNARYSVFDTSGRLVAEPRRPITSYSTWLWQGTVTDSGRVIEVAMVPGDENMRLMLLPLDSALRIQDTVRLPAFEPPSFRLDRGGSHVMYAIQFAATLLWTLDPHGSLWYAITDRYRVVHLSADGTPRLVIDKPFDRVAVSAAEKDRVMKGLASFVQQGGSVSRERFPDHKPPISALSLDDRGFVWTKLYQAEGATGERFDVFNPAGRYLGVVSTPMKLDGSILVRGAHLYAEAADDDGRPFVVRFLIRNR